MFGGSRRHRPPAPPLTAATANPNAATAAASAFMRRDPNTSSNLSAAAAATALRNRPTTPTNVAEVQTKRTRRRSASISSVGSDGQRLAGGPSTGAVAPGGSSTQRSGALHRTSSMSSMTERTFRSPSPHRNPPAQRATSFQHQTDVPPVPSIPAASAAASGDDELRRRPTSQGLKTQPFHVASESVRDAQGSWFGAATTAPDLTNVRPIQPAFQVSGHKDKEAQHAWYGAASVGDLTNVRSADADLTTRPGSVSPSINFSYPRGVRVASPEPSSPATMPTRRHTSPPRASVPIRPMSIGSNQDLVYDPNTRRLVTRAELLAVERSLQDVEEASVKKKKKVPTRSGSHLAHGTMGRTRVAAPQAEQLATDARYKSPPPQTESRYKSPPPPSKVVAPVTTSFATSQETEGAFQPAGRSVFDQPPPVTESEAAPEVRGLRSSDGATILPDAQRRETSQILGKKPSTVMEESEGDSELEAQPPELGGAMITPRRVSDAIDTVPDKPSDVPSSWPNDQVRQSSPIELPAGVTVQEQKMLAPGTETATVSGDAQRQSSVSGARVSSKSPPRQAHFAPKTDLLAVRHSPPPRAASPRKSALKHTSPTRGVSPSDDSSEMSGSVQIGPGGLPTPARDDHAAARKKSVRVSFDDENTMVVGQAASPEETESPVIASPQARRPWYSGLGRNKKLDNLGLDEDDYMKPRPALPSFGSIREKKTREQEERPLVRPAEPSRSPSLLTASPRSHPTTPNETKLDPLGQSSDHAIGSVLNQDFTSRNEANISKYREPLPPVVTSIEGSGYVSNSSTSSEDEDDGQSEVAVELETAPSTQQEVEETVAAPEKAANGFHGEQARVVPQEPAVPRPVPAIAISQPSPLPENSLEAKGLDIPGGFPAESSDGSVEGAPNSEEATTGTPSFTTEPTPESSLLRPDTKGKGPALDLDESSDGSSIYSDAYEDLSDVDEDGFMSLNAVVSNSIPPKLSRRMFEQSVASSSTEPKPPPVPEPPIDAPAVGVALLPEVAQPSTVEPTTDRPVDDWEKAKAYWRGLTMEKRRQLEREAMEEAGQDGDLEEAHRTKKKAKKKKSMERQRSFTDPASRQTDLDRPERVYQIQPGTRVADQQPRNVSQGSMTPPAAKLRKSMRGNPDQDRELAASHQGGLRRTMRSPPAQAAPPRDTGLRKSLRAEQPPLAGSSERMPQSMRGNGAGPQYDNYTRQAHTGIAARPPTSHDTAAGAAGSQKSKELSLDTSSKPPVAMATHAKPTLRRRGSDSSESSFKRSRPRLEGFGFRKTMRASSPPGSSPIAGDKGAGRLSLRSMSPPDSPRASAPPVSMRARMRQSMRSDSSDGSSHRVRLPSFGRSSAPKATSKKKGKFTSRFGDSSDEDAGVPSGFQSRFEDSSDEEVVPEKRSLVSRALPKSLRPGSRGSASAVPIVPVPAPVAPATVAQMQVEEASSSELPDSDDEVAAQQKAGSTTTFTVGALPGSPPGLGTLALQRKRSGRGALLTSATAPALSTQNMSGPSRAGQGRRSSLMSVLRRKKDDKAKIGRTELGESAARRDTKLERTPQQLSAIRSQTTSPKLQKQRKGENWPLPEPDDEGPIDSPEKEEEAKATEAQVPTAGEAGLQRRHTDQDELGALTSLKRPATSGTLTGVPSSATTSSLRPGFMKRRSTSTGLLGFGKSAPDVAVDYPAGPPTDIDGSIIGSGRRKKKFGALRRIFGLDD